MAHTSQELILHTQGAFQFDVDLLQGVLRLFAFGDVAEDAVRDRLTILDISATDAAFGNDGCSCLGPKNDLQLLWMTCGEQLLQRGAAMVMELRVDHVE